jgi:hypothetical protein
VDCLETFLVAGHIHWGVRVGFQRLVVHKIGRKTRFVGLLATGCRSVDGQVATRWDVPHTDTLLPHNRRANLAALWLKAPNALWVVVVRIRRVRLFTVVG